MKNGLRRGFGRHSAALFVLIRLDLAGHGRHGAIAADHGAVGQRAPLLGNARPARPARPVQAGQTWAILGSAGHSSAWLPITPARGYDNAERCMARRGEAGYGNAKRGRSAALHRVARRGEAGRAWLGLARHCPARLCSACRCSVRQGRRGPAQRGLAGLGVAEAEHGAARQGKARLA
jgi:hypothetical protein